MCIIGTTIQVSTVIPMPMLYVEVRERPQSPLGEPQFMLRLRSSFTTMVDCLTVTFTYTVLSSETLGVHIIINEVSMLAADIFAEMDDRLIQISYNYTEQFGGLISSCLVICVNYPLLESVPSLSEVVISYDQNEAFSSEVRWHRLGVLPLVSDCATERRTFSLILTKTVNGGLLKPDVKLIESHSVTADHAMAVAPSALRL